MVGLPSFWLGHLLDRVHSDLKTKVYALCAYFHKKNKKKKKSDKKKAYKIRATKITGSIHPLIIP